MGKFKVIDIDIYKVHLTVFVGSRKEFLEFIESCEDEDIKKFTQQIKKDIENKFQGAASTYWDNQNRVPIVYLPKISTSPEDLDTIVHELSHVVFAILGDVGITVDMYNNEAFAYLQGWLMKEIMDKEGYENF